VRAEKVRAEKGGEQTMGALVLYSEESFAW